MLSRFWRRIVPHRPTVDPDFHARMHTARAYGVTQKKASLQAQRDIRQAQANRVEEAYLHRRGRKPEGPPYE